jgi:hypothetical protein
MAVHGSPDVALPCRDILQEGTMVRRRFLATIGAAVGAVLLSLGAAEAGPIRRRRRRHRRRVRRRHRRRVGYRMVHGRRRLIVPLACVAGWELALDDRIVVVKEVRVVEKDGEKIETIVVQDIDNPKAKPEEIEIAREDTKENRSEMEGSEIPEGDEETPGVTTEVEVEDDKPDEGNDKR